MLRSIEQSRSLRVERLRAQVEEYQGMLENSGLVGYAQEVLKETDQSCFVQTAKLLHVRFGLVSFSLETRVCNSEALFLGLNKVHSTFTVILISISPQSCFDVHFPTNPESLFLILHMMLQLVTVSRSLGWTQLHAIYTQYRSFQSSFRVIDHVVNLDDLTHLDDSSQRTRCWLV